MHLTPDYKVDYVNMYPFRVSMMQTGMQMKTVINYHCHPSGRNIFLTPPAANYKYFLRTALMQMMLRQ